MNALANSWKGERNSTSSSIEEEEEVILLHV